MANQKIVPLHTFVSCSDGATYFSHFYFQFAVSLRVAKTEIIDFICLPDVRVVCTSSIEFDLRFYDVTASNFQLRIVISNLPFAVQTMHYWFGDATEEHCKIVLGDRGGNVTLLEFSSELRGPFQSKPGTLLVEITWKQFVKVNRCACDTFIYFEICFKLVETPHPLLSDFSFAV